MYLMFEARAVAKALLAGEFGPSHKNFTQDPRLGIMSAVFLDAPDLLSSSVSSRIPKTPTLANSQESKLIVNKGGSRSTAPSLANGAFLEVVIDLETTGLNTKVERIIQLAACLVGNPDQVYASYVKLPEGKTLTELIIKLTGITMNTLNTEGKSFGYVWDEFEAWLDVRRREMQTAKGLDSLPPVVLIAHNGKTFDYKIIEKEVSRIKTTSSPRYWVADGQSNESQSLWLSDSLITLKTKRMEKALVSKSRSLSNLYTALMGVAIANGHNAIADIQALEEILESEYVRDGWREVAQAELFRIDDISS
jgi:DNA polymerase III epsilon subunit-like protein